VICLPKISAGERITERNFRTDELYRKHGISQQKFYRWKAKCGGLEVSEAQRQRQLEEENRKLKQQVAEQEPDIAEADRFTLDPFHQMPGLNS
jgi:putative transposase